MTTENQEWVVESLRAAISQAREEVRAGDAKAFGLLSLVTGIFAGMIALTRWGLPLAAVVLLWLAAVPLAGAALVLLSTILPWLGEGEPGSFLHAARSTPHELVQLHASTGTTPLRLAVTLATVARIARRKHRRIRAAVLLLITGLVVLLLALAAAGV